METPGPSLEGDSPVEDRLDLPDTPAHVRGPQLQLAPIPALPVGVQVHKNIQNSPSSEVGCDEKIRMDAKIAAPPDDMLSTSEPFGVSGERGEVCHMSEVVTEGRSFKCSKHPFHNRM
jgi:hypothetical protein